MLVYLLGVDPVQATAYSLFIVGASSLVGVIPKYREGMVDLRTAVVFGIPSIAAVFATRKFIVPAIPDLVFSIGEFQVSKAILMMILFAVLMVAASVSMIREKKNTGSDKGQTIQYNYPMILAEGTVVGVLTGLVGAGGGFLIIPALVMLSKLDMKKAVGTSLLIIAAKSLIGFTGDISLSSGMDWTLLSLVTSLAMAGIFIGSFLSRRIDGSKLKKGFGWFVLVMGIYIILNELVLKSHPH